MGKAKKIASKVKQLATRTLQAEEEALKGLEEVKATSKIIHNADIIDAGAPLGKEHIATVNNINYAKLSDTERASVDKFFPSAKGDQIRAAQVGGKDLYYEGVLQEDQGLKNLRTQKDISKQEFTAQRSADDLSRAQAADAETINPTSLTKEEQAAEDLAKAQAEDYGTRIPDEPESIEVPPTQSNNKQSTRLRIKSGHDDFAFWDDGAVIQSNQRVKLGQDVPSNQYNVKTNISGFDFEQTKDTGKQKGFKIPQDPNNVVKRNPEDPIKFWNKRMYRLEENEPTSWGQTAKTVLGTAVGGAALMAALSGSRGQQNNAQLYGQQPLY